MLPEQAIEMCEAQACTPGNLFRGDRIGKMGFHEIHRLTDRRGINRLASLAEFDEQLISQERKFGKSGKFFPMKNLMDFAEDAGDF